ncbi:GNAT family N-acetyltransferase [Alkalihalobacillus pseudalcaliphilus]|uniref:GNAT family N-acetyltransferase n=1 Tax=Alkalihalobacillus pseudalcaliphilus TaxID=79884 RepID=UPI00064DC04F|nr:GNAT family protein [Alkalihalobacillus pseudalcaliphilus]KMK77517.1 acetyltransferase [Alkalihalobacillus pseudalcaliphilus]
MLFESSRLALRKISVDDIQIYHKWRNNLEVMYSTSPYLDVYSSDETESFVNNVILGSQTSKSYIMIDKETKVNIGIVSLINIDYKNQNAECIIDIGEKEYWGQGYGAEGLGLLLDYAFFELNLHRISLKVYSFNEKAIRLYERIGFQKEGVSRESLFRNNHWHDIIHMGVLKEEYTLTQE